MIIIEDGSGAIEYYYGKMVISKSGLIVFFARHSAYSYEDLPSDKLGAEFGANYFNPESELSLGEQLYNYLQGLGATIPEKASNYKDLPQKEPQKTPSRINKTTIPVYTKNNP